VAQFAVGVRRFTGGWEGGRVAQRSDQQQKAKRNRAFYRGAPVSSSFRCSAFLLHTQDSLFRLFHNLRTDPSASGFFHAVWISLAIGRAPN